jgi:hypothetical protein
MGIERAGGAADCCFSQRLEGGFGGDEFSSIAAGFGGGDVLTVMSERPR